MKLHSVRKDYKLSVLDKSSVSKNPLIQFEKWLGDAFKAKVPEPTAMSIATISPEGFPESRIVLLKDYNKNGFTFFTNYNSSKGKSIAKNPAVSLHFFWPELERQIRITGLVEKTATEISDKYFLSRPLLSQVAAVVSKQSSKIKSRADLQKLFDEKVKTDAIQRPQNWGGYIVRPIKYEFWQGRESRLHDRILFEMANDNWIISRLAP